MDCLHFQLRNQRFLRLFPCETSVFVFKLMTGPFIAVLPRHFLRLRIVFLEIGMLALLMRVSFYLLYRVCNQMLLAFLNSVAR